MDPEDGKGGVALGAAGVMMMCRRCRRRKEREEKSIRLQTPLRIPGKARKVKKGEEKSKTGMPREQNERIHVKMANLRREDTDRSGEIEKHVAYERQHTTTRT